MFGMSRQHCAQRIDWRTVRLYTLCLQSAACDTTTSSNATRTAAGWCICQELVDAVPTLIAIFSMPHGGNCNAKDIGGIRNALLHLIKLAFQHLEDYARVVQTLQLLLHSHMMLLQSMYVIIITTTTTTTTTGISMYSLNVRH
jgi:hypothetical protein